MGYLVAAVAFAFGLLVAEPHRIDTLKLVLLIMLEEYTCQQKIF
jgi:hypothetical protein